MAKIDTPKDDALDAQHECLETIVAQTHFVAIWGHSHDDFDDKIYSVDVYELPESFYSLNDAPLHEVRKKLDVGEQRYVDRGKIVRAEWHDSFESAMSVLSEVIQSHSDRIHEHA